MTPADRIAQLEAALAQAKELLIKVDMALRGALVWAGVRWGEPSSVEWALDGAIEAVRQRDAALKRAEEAEALAHKRLVRLHALAEDARQLSIVASFRSSEAAYTQMVAELSAALDAAGKEVW